MTSLREAAQQALEALEWFTASEPGDEPPINSAIAALRERLAQPEQEPVAWMHPSWIDPDTRGWANDSFNAIHIEGWVPVYPAPRQWQGLTDEDREEILQWVEWKEIGSDQSVAPQKLIAYVEKKLREKNNG